MGLLLLGCVLVVGAFVAVASGASFWSIGGLLVSSTALVVAMVILGWTWERVHHTDSQLSATKDSVDALHELFRDLPTHVGEVAEGDAEEDVEPKTQPVAEEAGLSLFTPEQIPLRVLSDLGRDDSLRTRRVTGAARREGRGNFPWLVGLDDGSRWRVAYGGQAKAGPTVDEIYE